MDNTHNMNICNYGCGKASTFMFKNGKYCCSSNANNCDGKKMKDSITKTGKSSGRKGITGIPWNKGLNKETNDSVKKGVKTFKSNIENKKTILYWKNKNHKVETKNKISKSMMGNSNAHHRGDRQSIYNGIRMDSSWEVKVAEYLDSNNINWKYNYVKYKLSDETTITPDFFILNNNSEIEKIIEVKGYFREANKIKFDKFLLEYPHLKIELWNKQILRNKGIRV